MQNSNFFKGPLDYAIDILDQINLQKMAGSQKKDIGMFLRKRKLKRRLADGYVDIFGLSVERFDLEAGLGGKGDEFLADGEGKSAPKWCFKCVLSNQSINH